MRQYLDLLQHVLDHGVDRSDRTGTGTRGVFGYQMRFDLSKGFPVTTTKKLHLRSIIHELLWFLKGDTNIKYLHDHGVTIWDEWADENGDLGPVYGKQWRSWPGGEDGKSIDQIRNLLVQLEKNPYSRRLIVSAWNPAEVDAMALPPCHCLFQFYVADGKLPCQLYQRSADIFLGVPFNIASYALLTMMIAQVRGLALGDFVHTLGDAHLYSNHFDQAREQLKRTPKPLPTMWINPKVKDLFAFEFDDFRLENYEADASIKAPIAVLMKVGIYVAIAENGVIGREGGLPWRLSSDLKRFKADTMGKPIVMGRKTWESFPKRPLPGRLNIVVTRDKAYKAEGGETAQSLGDAITLATVRARCMTDVDEICVIGGGQIYAQALPLADRLHITHVLATIDGDTVFPPIDPAIWRVLSSEDFPAGEKDSHATRYTVYERRAAVH